MKRNNVIKRTEEWLDDRYAIMFVENPPRQADVSYYKGALKALEFIGYSWERNAFGKHTLIKW